MYVIVFDGTLIKVEELLLTIRYSFIPDDEVKFPIKPFGVMLLKIKLVGWLVGATQGRIPDVVVNDTVNGFAALYLGPPLHKSLYEKT